MFLLKLYKFHRGLFALFTGFLLLFIFINAKQGAVITPVYQYGMFSEPFYLEDPHDAFVFNTDGEQLALEKLSFPARDIMLVSLQNYLNSREGNARVYKAIRPITDPVFQLPKTLTKTASAKEFNKWYVEMLSRLTKKEINTLEVYKRGVFWQNGLMLTQTHSKIFPIAE